MRGVGLAALLLALSGAAAAQEGPSAIVSLADGTRVPLRPWTFSYEYLAYPKGGSAALAPAARRESRSLWLGKRELDPAGQSLEIVYETVERQRDVDGKPEKLTLYLARELRLVAAGGQASVLKLEPPARESLVPGAAKDLIVAPRSLDLQGETLTGTRSSYCLASYTALVECGGDAAHRVTRVEFR